jgi:hypothetical protein
MQLEDFTDRMMEVLGQTPADECKEVGVGFGEVVAKAWRAAVGPMLVARGSKG